LDVSVRGLLKMKYGLIERTGSCFVKISRGFLHLRLHRRQRHESDNGQFMLFYESCFKF